MTTKNPVGRPSELEETLVKAKEYLNDGYIAAGDLVPSIEGLACYVKKSRSSIYKYAEENEEFSYTLEAIKDLQAKKLINGGLGGTYNAAITKLMMANHGYSERQVVDNTSSDGSMSPKTIEFVVVDENTDR